MWAVIGGVGAAILAGAIAFLSSARPRPTTPADRIGRLLTGQAKAGDGARVSEDLQLVRRSLSGTARELFDFAVLLRGLGQGGQGPADLERARAICERRRWVRCQKDELHIEDWLTGPLADTGAQRLEGVLEDLVWHLGSAREVREVLRPPKVLPAASEATKSHAVRTRLRLAAVAETPDAQAALLSELCAIRPTGCEEFPRQLEEMTRERAAGERLPPHGHP